MNRSTRLYKKIYKAEFNSDPEFCRAVTFFSSPPQTTC